jgi:hypothetical protein
VQLSTVAWKPVVMSSRPEIIYESARRFEVWTWGPGHRGLILRSNPAGGQRRRIEVWFKPGYAVCLQSALQGIQIIRAEANAPIDGALLGRPIELWEELFTVRSGESVGWVLAGGVHGREDDQDHHAPSMFDGSGLKPSERSLFSTGGT